MYEHLLEPLRYYETVGRAEHEANVTAHFEKLLSQSKVNVAENRATVKAYNAEKAAADKVARRITFKKVLRVLLIIGAVVGVILAVMGAMDISSSAGLLFGGIALTASSLIVIFVVLNKRIKAASEILEKHQKKAGELWNAAKAQVAPLNALFTEADTLRLIEKTLPDLEFEPCYSVQNETFFTECHDFVDRMGENCSMVNTLSGRLLGNPFLFCRRRICEIRDETYHGTLTISWTETYRDSDGKTRTRLRTQTLHASVQKPKPFYFNNTYLCYGSQAAPDLSFSRAPQHSERLSEKALDRKVRRGKRKLENKAEVALKKGQHFQEMANEEFDVLFGATNRDHETQFRLMYTPLAQTNTVDLLTSDTGYGDDFHFAKSHRCNVIESEHAARWAMDTDPANYYSHDVDEIRKKFISFNNEYFRSVFFDFAPLLAVPAYLEEPCASLEPPDDTLTYFTTYEHEVMANAIGAKRFAHPDSATETILKTHFVAKANGCDVVTVSAHSFSAHNRVDIVPRMGGDGRMHGVPVHWIEYLPLVRASEMTVRTQSDASASDATCLHGMAATVR